MIDIIYETIKTSYLKKLQIIQNIKNLMFKLIFIFSDWVSIKTIIVFFTPFYCWGKQIFKKMLPGGMSNLLLPRAWWQELRGEFWVGRGILERDKILLKYEKMYPWGYSWRTKVVIKTVYHFVDSNLGVKVSSKKRG